MTRSEEVPPEVATVADDVDPTLDRPEPTLTAEDSKPAVSVPNEAVDTSEPHEILRPLTRRERKVERYGSADQ